PLVGIHALHNTVDRVGGDQGYLPILQHVALSNKHINHPNMGPYILADAEPLDSGGVEATKKAFFACVDRGLYNGADRHFLWLWDNIPRGEALDLLLTVASRRTRSTITTSSSPCSRGAPSTGWDAGTRRS